MSISSRAICPTAPRSWRRSRGSASSSTAPPGSRTGARARRSSAVNRDGAANVVAAAREAGVERVVHLELAHGPRAPPRRRAGRRVDALASGRLDPYSESKLAGERLVREAHGQGGLATVVVRPGAIWGPGDPHILPRIVALLRRGRMVYIGGGRNHVGLSHVENLSLGLALAAEVAAAAGRVYHVTDAEDLTARQVHRRAGRRASGTPRPRLSVPFLAVYGAAALLEAGARLAGRTQPPPLTRYGVRLVACDCRYDHSQGRARARLRAGRLVRAGRGGARATLASARLIRGLVRGRAALSRARTDENARRRGARVDVHGTGGRACLARSRSRASASTCRRRCSRPRS